MKLENIFAKSAPNAELLTTHTENALAIWRQVKDVYYRDLPYDSFWKDSFISILFHDFGKVSQNFQNQLNAGKSWSGPWLRHEFLSGLFLYACRQTHYDEFAGSLFAVYAHHKPLNDDLFQKGRGINLYIEQSIITEFIEFAKKRYHLEWGETLEIKDEQGIRVLKNLYEKLLYAYSESTRKLFNKAQAQLRQQYILHKGILHISDWTASGHDQLMHFTLQYDEIYLKEKVGSKLVIDKKINHINDLKWRDFQRISGETVNKNVIAIAPTGSGKTEAALLWAASKQPQDRIIYLLPTRVTSNALFKRLQSYFGNDYIAIVHSSAIFFRKDYDDQEYDKKKYLKDRCFFRTINICTIDQVLSQGFNLGYWEMKTFFMLGARIIIDEIHLYEPYTLGLIIGSITYLKKEFNARFYIMTATMPQKLKSILQKALGDPVLIEDRELLDRARNIVEVRDLLLDEITPEIIKSLSSKVNCKVLVVLNTVDEAIRLYNHIHSKVSDKRIICYHSRFIQKDRTKKETELLEFNETDEGGILIATQVVEVSLDIDFDLLFSENAPIDALIQRAGRVNRKGGKDYTKVVVFKHSPIAEEKIYDTPGILQKTFELLQQNHGKRLTEAEYIQLVDEVYKDYDIENDNIFKDALHKYQRIQREQYQIKDLFGSDEVYTREGLDSVTVIPAVFEELLHNATIEEKEKFTLSIRRQRYHQCKAGKDDEGYLYVIGDYSYKKGYEFPTVTRIAYDNKATIT